MHKHNYFPNTIAIMTLLTPLFFLLASGKGTLEGRVVDAVTGVSIHNATVYILDRGVPVERAYTDANGYYVMTGIPEGYFDMEFEHQEYEICHIEDVAITTDGISRQDAELWFADDSIYDWWMNIDAPRVFDGTTFTGEEIRKMPVDDFDDLLRTLPGVF